MNPQPSPGSATKEKRLWDGMPLLARQSTPPTFGPNAKFIYFKHLPQELRLGIWGRATLPPPAVHMGSGGTHNIAAILHACSKSRREFLAKEGVTKGYPTYLQIPLDDDNTPRTMLFCPEQDVMEPPRTSRSERDVFESGDFDFLFSKIRYLLLDRQQPYAWLGPEDKMVDVRKLFICSHSTPHGFPNNFVTSRIARLTIKLLEAENDVLQLGLTRKLKACFPDNEIEVLEFTIVQKSKMSGRMADILCKGNFQGLSWWGRVQPGNQGFGGFWWFIS